MSDRIYEAVVNADREDIVNIVRAACNLTNTIYEFSLLPVAHIPEGRKDDVFRLRKALEGIMDFDEVEYDDKD